MKIVIKLTGGGVSVMTVIGDSDVEDCIEKWKESNPGLYASSISMPDDAIPATRELRHLWDDITTDAVIDINQALNPAVSVMPT